MTDEAELLNANTELESSLLSLFDKEFIARLRASKLSPDLVIRAMASRNVAVRQEADGEARYLVFESAATGSVVAKHWDSTASALAGFAEEMAEAEIGDLLDVSHERR